MKALILSNLNKSQLALDLVKKTVFKNMKNFTCWHVQGMIMKRCKDYDSAKKSFMMALKCQPQGTDNLYRDISSTQVHMRDFAGFQETRRQMLINKPEERDVWQSYAVACFMNQDYVNCLSTLDSILKFMAESAESKKKVWDLTPV